MRAPLQYVNDNLLRKKMRNGSALKCDVRRDRKALIYVHRGRKVCFVLMETVRCSQQDKREQS